MEQFICRYCEKVCKNANALRNHERLCKLNPNHQHHTGFEPGWNRGLTKENNNILKSISNKLKKEFKPYFCKTCGKLVTSKYGSGIFCSKSCACKRKHTEEEKQKIKNKLLVIASNKPKRFKTCIICGKLFEYTSRKNKGKTCSKECSLKLKIIKAKEIQNKLVKEGKHKGWTTRNIESYPEKFFKKVLENNNIDYEFNKPITKNELGIQENGCYFLDFALKNNIDLEIDGKQHLVKERHQHDIVRDNRLKKNGWKVYRIAWKSLPKNNEYIKVEIDKFIKWYKENC